MSLKKHYNAIKAERDKLVREVKEWMCEACNFVYPGPPQEGLACVLCPRCGGHTSPRERVEHRHLIAGLKDRLALVTDDRDHLALEVGRLAGELAEARALIGRVTFYKEDLAERGEAFLSRTTPK